jgi:hypothetical protein
LRLTALVENPALRDNPEIRLEEAKGAVNAIGYYGTAARFDDLERWGLRLTALAENPALRDNPEIRLMEATGAVNATIGYGNASRHGDPRNRSWRARLAVVARRFPGHPQIQEVANRFGLTYVAQASKGWPYGAPAPILPPPPEAQGRVSDRKVQNTARPSSVSRLRREPPSPTRG